MCTSGEASALSELSCEVAAKLGNPSGRILVAALPLVADRALPAPTGDGLSDRLATAVATQFGTGSRVARAATLSAARALANGESRVVLVAGTLSGGELRITADSYPVSGGFWDRVRGVPSSPTAHARAVRSIDAEVAALLPPVNLATRAVEKVPASGDVAVALSCGDVAGDGATALVVVGRHRVALERLAAGHFVTVTESPWTKLSPVSPAPLREPIGAAVIRPNHVVDVGLTDRERGLRLSATLDVVAPLGGLVPVFGAGCLGRSGLGVGHAKPCATGETPRLDLSAASDVDAVAGANSVERDGSARSLVALRHRTDGTVTLRDDRGQTATIPDVGASLAVGDLDLDGDPELVASVNTPNPADDAVVVRTWGHDGTVRERFRVPVPEGVHAVAICPPTGASIRPVVIATASGFWVLR
ncbi:MAG TPA: hypothetical protein VH142_16300 [Polyangiaceae bacterium]|nr:hypothetical protein [Polyangiaceae bacterium]